MMVLELEGAFKTFDASISALGYDFFNASVEFAANTSRLSTDNDMRDQHVKSDAFLDVVKYPTITFKSTAFETKTVVLNATRRTEEDMKHNLIVGFKIDVVIKRSDFAIGAGFGAKTLSDEAAFPANTEFIKG